MTKGDGERDFDLLDGEDWYGVTMDGVNESGSGIVNLFNDIFKAHQRGIKTWISFEPVIDPNSVLGLLLVVSDFVDKVKIGKLNYHKSDVNWAEFGRAAEKTCQKLGLNYYIKESLRREMEK